MAWTQVTEEAKCKECGSTFASKMVFGQMTTRCNTCRDKKGFAYVPKPSYSVPLKPLALKAGVFSVIVTNYDSDGRRPQHVSSEHVSREEAQRAADSYNMGSDYSVARVA